MYIHPYILLYADFCAFYSVELNSYRGPDGEKNFYRKDSCITARYEKEGGAYVSMERLVFGKTETR